MRVGLIARAAVVAALAVILAACGSGTTTGASETATTATPTAPVVNNVQPITVDSGPTDLPTNYGNVNVLYTTVVICVPGTATCQSIDHVMVDTGSTGLRILGSALTLSLPINPASATGAPLANCVQYADNTFQWGPVATADVKLAGEVASSVPIQVGGQTGFASAPTACSEGGTEVDTLLDLGANGVLGVGLFRQDCGAACTAATTNPGVYFSCGSSGCVTTPVTLAEQLQNPAWMFSQDNNGLIINLPAIGVAGQGTVSGSMIFGIGTQSNNALGAARAQASDDIGNFTTTYNGASYNQSFIDSGSNGYFFLTPTPTLPDCGNQATGFYCPTATVNLTAINSAPNPSGLGAAVSTNVAFSIANALALSETPNVAFNNLGGANPGAFDWGLPFFFGRPVFIGIESQTSTAGIGPYWAY